MSVHAPDREPQHERELTDSEHQVVRIESVRDRRVQVREIPHPGQHHAGTEKPRQECRPHHDGADDDAPHAEEHEIEVVGLIVPGKEQERDRNALLGGERTELDGPLQRDQSA